MCCFDMYPVGLVYDCLFYCICLRARLEIHLINAELNPRCGIHKDDDALVQRCTTSSTIWRLGVFEAPRVYTVISLIDFFLFFCVL